MAKIKKEKTEYEVKFVKNVSSMRIELPFGEETIVLLPKITTQVPKNFVIPRDLQIIEK